MTRYLTIININIYIIYNKEETRLDYNHKKGVKGQSAHRKPRFAPVNEMATREDRIFWQALKICPMCEKNHLYNGEKICIECKAYHNEFNHKYYLAHKEKMKAQFRKNNRTLYQKRKEQGLCTKCGSKFLKPGRSKCYQCLAKDQDIARRYRDRLNGGVVIDG